MEWHGVALCRDFRNRGDRDEGLQFYINSMDIPADEMLDPYGRLKLFIVVGVMVLVISALPLGRYLAESQDEQDKA